MDSPLLFHPSWALLFGIGVVSGYLNVLAGGGSVLTLPVLIFMGLDGALANGTNRIAILIQNISSVSEFHRARKYPVREVAGYALWTLPGAAAGAWYATTISDELFQRILGVIVIGVVITLLVPQRAVVPEPGGAGGRRSPWIYPALLAIGFYGGFIQVGVGFMFMAALFHLLRIDLVTVNMYKVFIVLLYTIPALGIFLLSGNVDWVLGWILAAGSAFGAWLAVRASIRGGEQVIRIALVVALLLMGARLLDIF